MAASSSGRSDESLASLLGGRRGAVDATIPPLAFGLAWWLSSGSVLTGVAVAVAASAALAAWRLGRGSKPRSVLVGLAGVCVAGMIALYTGRAEDFFLLRILSNGGSLLAWAISIVIRWPLLGVVVGVVLGQKIRWRRDPALVRAYGRASWIWVGQYAVRLLVFIPLWWFGFAGALAVAQAVLTWPLVAVCLAVSWWVLRRSLPDDHPGLRHPVTEPVAP
ncbi:DUF3159 domain-containing protein [Stackebrandtia nassauensis]|uniref:DNA internalization-related competence protein ComEC/Rec2 n=1 Tax=Stackebrandtia nassauensis (strain DSM 44728 / CIP 108903 / NRRL B-16338 / NBRC 102104 / LLR-40K-21) TaxID=446470 RepID=D3PZM6_STANL|nr:DUF3159 domain-containing protein [Stackebrandtia nassauensis]ADD43563.1 DNA internalization-related competence protein ComEC/Rec2 [Stackebrandtia nassauensis DSM 44728]